MKSRKLLSLFLALMMLLSVVPFYASAEAIALTEANIVEWPTVEYKTEDGLYYYGQDLNTCLALVGGVVTTDGTAEGTVVPGKFEFNYATYPINGTRNAYIKFVPTDEDVYTGFSVDNTSNVTFVVTKTTPVFVDEINDPIIATEVMPGAKLSTSTLSGGQVKNPYNESESKALAAKWRWTKSSTIITESGYYQAALVVNTSYTYLFKDIYVKVKENTVTTEISTPPTIEAMTYDGTTTWADVTLTGGKVVEEGTETEVAGTFAVTTVDGSKVLNSVVTVGTHEVTVTFTPDDAEKYLTSTTTVTVEVAKAPIIFVDENGAETVPEITVPYGTELDSSFTNYYIKKQLAVNCDELWSANFLNLEHDGKILDTVGTSEYTVNLLPYSAKTNFEANVATFRVTVEPATVAMRVANVVDVEEKALNERALRVEKVKTNDPTPQGSFDVYADDVLIADDVTGTFKWTPTETKEYTLRVVYNPIENDPCFVEEFTQAYPVTMERRIKSSGNVDAPVTVQCGKEVTVYWRGATEEFKGWTVTDADGNAVDLGVDLNSDKITFTMPDCDLVITEYCDHLCHSDFFLAKIIWKVLNIIFRLFDVQQYCDCGNLHYEAPFFG